MIFRSCTCLHKHLAQCRLADYKQHTAHTGKLQHAKLAVAISSDLAAARAASQSSLTSPPRPPKLHMHMPSSTKRHSACQPDNHPDRDRGPHPGKAASLPPTHQQHDGRDQACRAPTLPGTTATMPIVLARQAAIAVGVRDNAADIAALIPVHQAMVGAGREVVLADNLIALALCDAGDCLAAICSVLVAKLALHVLLREKGGHRGSMRRQRRRTREPRMR